MDKKVKRFTEKMDLNPPAIVEMLDDVQAKLKIIFPKEYIEFMLEYNGAEGQVGSNSYLMIWSTEQIIPFNDGYAVNEFTPGLVYFGSDGGGMAYAFDFRTPTTSIVEFPFESIQIEDANLCGTTFNEFLEHLYNA